MAASGRISAPFPFPTRGLACWLRADRGIVYSNGKVGGWLDLSGNGNNFAGTVTSVSATGGPNSTPALSFNGTTDALTNAGTLGISKQNWTMYLVLKYPSATPGAFQFAFGIGDAAGAAGIEIGASSLNKRCVNASSVTLMPGAALTTSWEIWSVTNTSVGPLTTLAVNGTNDPLSPNNATPGNFSGGTNIGQRGGGTLFFPGLFAEAIVKGVVETAAEVEQTNKYLSARYGITVP